MSLRVWVVDDGPSNARLVERSLPGADWELHHYLDPSEAVLVLQALLDAGDEGLAELPDLVFMDYFMPQMSGVEATLAMRGACARAGRRGPFIVGHSSVYRCSQEIAAVGGDAALAKDARWPRSPEIARLWPDAAALAGLEGWARQPA